MDNLSSKTRIQNAFLELLETEHIEKISISKIIEKANVSRTTYYRYYYEQREILEDIVRELIEQMEKTTSSIGTPDIFVEDNLQYMLAVYMELKSYYENAGLLRKLYKSDAAEYLRLELYKHYEKMFDTMMTQAQEHPTREFIVTQEDYDFYKRYSFAGHYDIIRGWIIGGCKTPIEDLVKFIVKTGSANNAFFSFPDETDKIE